MIEPRSTATIRALASLAELSANQLEDGVSVEEVVATLRKAAEAVRLVVDTDEAAMLDADVDLDIDIEVDLEAEADSEAEAEETDIVQDLTPMDLSEEEADSKIVALDKEQAKAEAAEDAEEPVLNAG
ncbi:hypothetical protein [Labrenzia sp. VG12]|uniref:hypothetical protein n=1 Tax=Labrenzia sp. VG12 TaxID=2021862 RepID=UPI000B8BBA16|nr:hypothetical protein [Labrenzia sp. VG12]ASP35126.1 hypothetical protein CHH27_19320 [Labrenzia sp. VG12]